MKERRERVESRICIYVKPSTQDIIDDVLSYSEDPNLSELFRKLLIDYQKNLLSPEYQRKRLRDNQSEIDRLITEKQEIEKMIEFAEARKFVNKEEHEEKIVEKEIKKVVDEQESVKDYTTRMKERRIKTLTLDYKLPEETVKQLIDNYESLNDKNLDFWTFIKNHGYEMPKQKRTLNKIEVKTE
jgi:hypothetical protein